jgi:hypothetical protein
MSLPDDFPAKAALEKEGYDSVDEVSEATDEELLQISGIAEGTLAKIREKAPFRPSSDETGTGATSGGEVPDGVDPDKAQSVANQTAKMAKDQTDPITGEKLPEGIVKNERGTLSASSTVEQADMVSPDQVKAEREAMFRNARDRMAAIFTE